MIPRKFIHSVKCRWILIVCLLTVLFSGCDQGITEQQIPSGQQTKQVQSTVVPTPAADPAAQSLGLQKIKEAYQQRQSDFFVEAGGQVVKILADDNDGSRHQRFIVQIEAGHSVLVSHNIDIAPRVEGISVGDTVVFYGEYEWNNKGGVIHWTHHDPQQRRPGGWILHNGQRYE